jgi:release factor glutamine methyltransferase
MKVNDWLAQAEQQLTVANVPIARLDALVLLEDCLKKDRAYLLAHPETVLDSAQQQALAAQLKRRCAHEPLAYIRGYSEFYGRQFIVTNKVLEPRPESETMIDLLKQHAAQASHIADIGTGSGALAITAKLELPSAQVAAVDIDEQCLKVAARNASNLGVSIELLSGDLLQPFLQKSCNFMPDVLLCNLPYVPDDFHINRAASHEPDLALFGGPDGLDLYRRLFAQVDRLQTKPVIMTESLPNQHAELQAIAVNHGYTLATKDDFIQLFTAA